MSTRCHTSPSTLVASTVVGVEPLAVHARATNPLEATTTVPMLEPSPAWSAAVSAEANVTPPSVDTHAAACITSPASIQPVTTIVGPAAATPEAPPNVDSPIGSCVRCHESVARIATIGCRDPDSSRM